MAPGKKSEIWRYFTPFDKDRVKCNICEKVYSRAGRTTSGLRTHLKAVHAEEFELLIRAETELQASKMIISPETPLKEDAIFTEHSQELYAKVANKVKFILSDLKFMSFTTDIWSEPATNVSLLSLTCHGITANFNRLSIILKCEEFHERHTGDVIASKFESMLNEWNILKEQVHCMVRDEGSNMKRAMSLAGFKDIDCTVHKLQTNIKTALNSQEYLVALTQKCNKIAGHFKHSTIAQDQLSKVQLRLNPDQVPLTVIRDCSTRWNSTFYMFQRFLKLKDALAIYGNSNNVPNLSSDEYKAIENCVLILKPFEEATRNLSSSDSSISSVIPIIYMLKKGIEDLNLPVEGDTVDNIMQNFTQVLKTQMNKKFCNLENDPLFTIATSLDPRYKNKFFIDIVKDNVNTEIIKLALDLLNQNRSSSISSGKKPKNTKSIDDNEPSTSADYPTKSLITNLARILDSLSDGDNSDDETEPEVTILCQIKSQLKSYLKEKRISLNENPLDWWKSKAKFDK
ncbi:Zinc finger BED domain-containing protein 4 [Eumeta japonica]|uniref:Zinc finger BED domain-containing protein 4 n=1 Tax=Eumeta variegata TaxID=151549 RepID=A0A4C1Y319_EUMVA|nr:Zinc finger BED domain-containing protein 4 [Eumeta japonica]